MEIQDFILRYTGVQTIDRARRVYAEYVKYWDEFFQRLSVEYFGVRYVEIEKLTQNLERELTATIEEAVRKKLYYLISYSGEQVIEKAAFMKIMQVWAAFSANDINNDNELDVVEIKLMMWLMEGARPIN